MNIGSAGARGWLILSVLLCSCSSTGPTSGVLNVKLSSPHTDDGAVLFTVTGGPVESVETASGTIHSLRIDPNTLRVVVTGSLSSGTIAQIRIADLTQVARYSVVVNQVAARATYVLRDPAAYSITLGP